MRILQKSLLALGAVMIMSTAWAQKQMTREQYIKKYKDLVLESQEVYGIPASIKMAQALLESDNGNSRLATEANNHFGIKCKKEWAGESITHDDDAPSECFRKYPSAQDSFKDHSEFLDKSPRYEQLFNLDPLDYKAWAYGLKAAGYATNPKYPELLIKIIEDYKLYTLDRDHKLADDMNDSQTEAEKATMKPTIEIAVTDKIDMDNYIVSLNNVKGYNIYSNNGSEFVVAGTDDTYERIAKVFGISIKRLYKFNDLEAGAQLSKGDVVYIKSKSKRANNGKLIHIVKEGDTMHSISQRYGIRLKNLATINRREKNAELHEGQQIRLM